MEPRAMSSVVDGARPGASAVDGAGAAATGGGGGGRGGAAGGVAAGAAGCGWLHGRDKGERDGVEKCERRDKVEERFKIKNNFLE
jgi:hypothetical protein